MPWWRACSLELRRLLQQLHNDQQVHAIMYVISASAGITVSVSSFGQVSLKASHAVMQ
jgi:hypothetical protein